ncbi:MAG: hypothetical protein U0Z44_02335 [Kouleothrix sp.]|jgi:hypothetical protein
MRAILPTVEAALAAHGYTVESPLAKDLNGDRMIVMTRSSTVVLLSECAQSEVADIEIYGAAPAAATALLEQLPIRLFRQAAHHEIRSRQN